MKPNLKNFSFSFKSQYLQKHIGMVFWVLLVLLLVAEGLVIKKSVDLALSANRPQAAFKYTPGVRINFESYKLVTERIEKAKTFRPSSAPQNNPFRQ